MQERAGPPLWCRGAVLRWQWSATLEDQMQISVTFRHMDATDALRGYAEEKIEKALRKYLKTPFEAHVVLSTERHHHVCDVTVLVAGHTIKGTEKTDSMYSSIDKVGDKIERQVSRYKAKLRNHKPSHHDAELRAPEVLLSILDQADAPAPKVEGEEHAPPENRVTKTDVLVANPMTVDEAVMALDLSGSAFLIFTNRATQGVSVLYRVEEGKFGLIDTKNS
jgi:putative sigma-54 modulation protein